MIVPYGLWRLEEARKAGFLVLVEGESDSWTLWFHHLSCLGLPGADMAGKLEAAHLAGIGRVYVVREPEDGGTTFVNGVTKRLFEIGWTGNANQVVLQLARVAKAKTDLPAELIERAKDPEEPAAKLREDVDILLYRGAPDHSDGPKRSLVLVAGKKLIEGIEEKIGRLRPAATEEGATAQASDAEVVDFALADCLSGIQEAEDHEMDQSMQGRERCLS